MVRLTGHPPLSKTFGKKREAFLWGRDIEDAIRRGEYLPAAAIEKRTLSDLIDRYIKEIGPTKKTGLRQVPQLDEWRRLIGAYELSKLRPAHVADARDKIAQGRGPATVVRYLAALSHVFTVAVKDWQLSEKNPVQLITWPKEPRGRVRFLSDDERARLLAACKVSRCPVLHDVVLLALLTGMRRGEILNLRFSNVDLDRSRIILTETKNNERRRVPLVPEALAMLKRCQPRRKLPGMKLDTALVFARDAYRRLPFDITHYWTLAVNKAGIDDFRFHDLHHTAAPYFAMTGATTNEIAEILGHKTLAMVKRYAHLTDTHTGKVMERMASVYFPSETDGKPDKDKQVITVRYEIQVIK